MRTEQTDAREHTRPLPPPFRVQQEHVMLAAIVRQIMSDYRARLAAGDLAREGVSLAAGEEPEREHAD